LTQRECNVIMIVSRIFETKIKSRAASFSSGLAEHICSRSQARPQPAQFRRATIQTVSAFLGLRVCLKGERRGVEISFVFDAETNSARTRLRLPQERSACLWATSTACLRTLAR
jgi:hypothetical protein